MGHGAWRGLCHLFFPWQGDGEATVPRNLKFGSAMIIVTVVPFHRTRQFTEQGHVLISFHAPDHCLWSGLLPPYRCDSDGLLQGHAIQRF